MELGLPTARAQRWFRRRTYSGGAFPRVAELAARKRASGERISVVLPALNEAATIHAICDAVRGKLMERDELVDELIVMDSGSTDGTNDVARAAGATVLQVAEVLPEIPPLPGKGEALWRSLAAAGDIVCWIDSDIRNFGPHFVLRLVAPLLIEPEIAFVKAFYRRPVERGAELVPDEGGRVTELLARPLLGALFPELAGFAQPLAGEYAGRTELLRRVPFFTGYSVEVGLLIDLLHAAGIDALAQADLGERVHRNRPLSELGPMAHSIARTILSRAEEHGRIRSALDVESPPFVRPGPDGLETRAVLELERPPMDRVLAAAAEPSSDDGPGAIAIG
jgi:glucosyl-3-phosphoglycerate synthase